MSAALDDLLARLRTALGRAAGEAPPAVPGAAIAPRLTPIEDLLQAFIATATRNGCEIVRTNDPEQALAHLIPPGARVQRDGPREHHPFDLDFTATRADLAIAASGAVLLTGDALPPMSAHTLVVLLHEHAIVPTLRDALTARAGRPVPATRLIVTGPSKTADIEGILITGVHGPKRVVLVLTP